MQTLQENRGRKKNRSRVKDQKLTIEERNKMLEDYLPLVRTIAADLCANTSANVEFDDLMSTGIFGLIDAVESFDPDRNVKFSTYCKPRIRGAMIDALRETDWVPRLTRQRCNKLKRAWSSLESRLEREPTEKELMDELDVPLKEFKRIIRDSTPVSLIPLSHVASTVDDDDLGLDTIKNEKVVEPDFDLERLDSYEYIVKTLSRVERIIIDLYYNESLTMCQIGKVLNISESRVSQIHTEVLDRLREMIMGDESIFEELFG